MSDDLRIPRTDPLLPPGMTDRDTEPVPGDDSDGTCPDCGAPLDDLGCCPDDQCRQWRAAEDWAEENRTEP